MDHAEHTGHGDHGGHADRAAQFRDRFWLSLALTVPVVVYSEMVQEWFGFTPPQFPGSDWVAPVLGTVVFLYGGRPFLEGGLAEARAHQPGMMLLISWPSWSGSRPAPPPPSACSTWSSGGSWPC
jgi:P-type Cu2+ transporter